MLAIWIRQNILPNTEVIVGHLGTMKKYCRTFRDAFGHLGTCGHLGTTQTCGRLGTQHTSLRYIEPPRWRRLLWDCRE